MKEAAFLAIGDLHLTDYIWRNQKHVYGDAASAFSEIIDLAIKERTALVLVGDIFDNVTPEPHLIKFFRSQIDKMQSAGVDVYAIQGNHDLRPTPWPGAIHDFVQQIGDGIPTDINGLSVVGLDYGPKSKFLERISALPKQFDVLFLHQAARQYLHYENAWNADLDDITSDIRLIVMGDIHVCWDAKLKSGAHALYTGASHPRNISQVGQHSVVRVYTDGTWNRVPLQRSRRIQVFRLNTPQDVKSMDSALPLLADESASLTPLAYIFHLPSFASALASMPPIKGLLTIAVEAEDPSTAEDDKSESVIALEDINVRSMLESFISPVDNPQAYALALRLLEEFQDPSEVVKEERKKFLAAAASCT